MKQQARPWNSPLVVFVVVFCLVLATGTFVARELNANPRRAGKVDDSTAGDAKRGEFKRGAEKLAFVRDWRSIAAVGHATGDSAAPIRVILFADYQCPGCAVLHRLLAVAADSLQRRLQVVTRHYPLSSHAFARAAANAAECAGVERKFDAFQDIAYSAQDSIGHAPWSWFAARAGIRDTVAFNRCVSTEQFRAAVERDHAVATALRFPGTPVYIVNGQPRFGAPAFAELMKQLSAGDAHATR